MPGLARRSDEPSAARGAQGGRWEEAASSRKDMKFPIPILWSFHLCPHLCPHFCISISVSVYKIVSKIDSAPPPAHRATRILHIVPTLVHRFQHFSSFTGDGPVRYTCHRGNSTGHLVKCPFIWYTTSKSCQSFLNDS
eukprot:1048987-Prorocentrum_minimum.AAC.1